MVTTVLGQRTSRGGWALVAGATVVLIGCASLAKDERSDQLTIAQSSSNDFKAVAFEQTTGLAAYEFMKQPFKVEWIDCKTSKPRGTIFAMHRDRAGFEDKKFCDGWIAQTFLSQGFDVITVNRPGYGDSDGVVDFAGAQSMVALATGLKAALAKGANPKPVEGVWGYSTGASAAALYAKSHPGLKFLILGGGIYDYEQTLKETSDDYIRKDIEAIQKTGGAKAMEDRSVAYDVSGLPPVIVMYHGKLDTSAPLEQAKAFNDGLLSSGGYKVNYQVIEGVTHEMPWTQHRKILEILLRSTSQAG
jgi:hypothetical protein